MPKLDYIATWDRFEFFGNNIRAKTMIEPARALLLSLA